MTSALAKKLTDTQRRECDAETLRIRERSKTPEAKRRHKFRPAKFTHKNGHPRCLVCGDEERIGGVCDGVEKQVITTDTGGLAQPARAKPLPKDGLVISPESQAKLLADGAKTMVVKSRPFKIAGELFLLLSGNAALGVIRLAEPREIKSLAEFRALSGKHRIPETLRAKWCAAQPAWCEAPLWGYDIASFDRFAKPLPVNRRRGPQVVERDVRIGKAEPGFGPPVPNADLNLRDANVPPMRCKPCRYFVAPTGCKVVVGPVAANLVCDAYQGTEGLRTYDVSPGDFQAFVRGMEREQPYSHVVIDGHDTPVGPLVIIEDTMQPKPHRFSLTRDFHLAHTGSEHSWSQEEVDHLVAIGKAIHVEFERTLELSARLAADSPAFVKRTLRFVTGPAGVVSFLRGFPPLMAALRDELWKLRPEGADLVVKQDKQGVVATAKDLLKALRSVVPKIPKGAARARAVAQDAVKSLATLGGLVRSFARAEDEPVIKGALVPVSMRGPLPLPSNVVTTIERARGLRAGKPNGRRMIDMFCGMGAYSLGFEKAGFKPAVAMEMEPLAARTYAANRPGVPVLFGDCRKFPPADVAALAGRVDAVIGGVPCEPFSEVNTSAGRGDDPRRGLIHYAMRVVAAAKPRVFAFENVRRAAKSAEWERAKARIRRAGYDVDVWNLRAHEHGAATVRPRAFLVGVRNGRVPGEGDVRRATPKTLKDALSGLGRPTSDGPHADPGKLNTTVRGLVARATPGRTFSRPGSTFPCGALLSWTEPAPTIAASSGYYVHPGGGRVLTGREMARVQGLPDSYKFVAHGRAAMQSLLGDCVPVSLGFAVAATLARVTTKSETRVADDPDAFEHLADCLEVEKRTAVDLPPNVVTDLDGLVKFVRGRASAESPG